MVPRIDTAAVATELRDRLDEWRALLKAEPVKARQILRKLLKGRLVFEPDPERREYRFHGETSYGRLLAGLVHNRECPRPSTPVRHDVLRALPRVSFCGAVRAERRYAIRVTGV